MALAIFTYRPIFSTFLKDTDIMEWVKQSPVQKGDIKVTQTAMKSVMIIDTSIIYALPNGAMYTAIKTDTVQTAKVYQSSFKIVNKHISTSTYWKFIGLVFLLILYVTMVYGPIAAFLVEMFPTKIRYTSMSLPYHIGNGVFGGLVPFIGLLLTSTYTADPLVGLWYPIGVAALCLVIGVLYLSNKIDRNIKD